MLRSPVARAWTLALTLAAFTPSLALADVGPAPKCPEGLKSSYDKGRFCAVIECSSDAECGSEKCVERPVCLKERGETFDYEGECSGACGSGECLTKKICTVESESTPEKGTPTGGQRSCGCAVPGDDRGWSAVVGLGLVTAVGVRLASKRRARRF